MKAIQIDFRAGSPIYIQIVEQIRQQVASGELKPNDQLPTVRQLASELRVNFNTIARAYRILDEAGLISTQQGRGTYIASRLGEGQVQKMRLDKLRAMLGQVIREARVLGYGREEIEQIVEEQLHETD